MLSLYIEESGGTIINALNTSGNEKCITNIMRENFHPNSTVIIFLSNHPDYSRFESNFVRNIFNSINCKVVVYSAAMHHSRVRFACSILIDNFDVSYGSILDGPDWL